ncbi:MAG: N-acetylmuramoyl-L-alanine amidase [Pseudomonadota bacterium]|nr:N-acetylmuramoyl-L-alanine amidase [Pseudomonadota bacterium]
MAIDLVILHYTGMHTAVAALDRLCNPQTSVSAHYLIAEDGTVFRLVKEAKRAWHAGAGHWCGATNINDRSIGIEMVNPGHEIGYRAFPEVQMVALERLLKNILSRHPISPARVVGHSDVAPTRKQDPGEFFNWQRLAAAGLAIWPERLDEAAPFADLPHLLTAIGYDPLAPLRDVITAFQRRFVPGLVTGIADATTRATIAAVYRIPA